MMPQRTLMPPPGKGINMQFDRGVCKTPEAIQIESQTDTWSRFYVVRNVCVKGSQRCGTQPRNGYDDEPIFNPLSVLSTWLDMYPTTCPENRAKHRREAIGLAFIVQHVDTFYPSTSATRLTACSRSTRT